MHLASIAQAITMPEQFELSYTRKVKAMLAQKPVNRGPAHATKDDTMASTHELMHVTESLNIPLSQELLAELVSPNLPWAEDHFQERVGGEPLNPAPSEAWWPFARAGNAEHKQAELFSHTYPERFWPKRAGHQGQKLDFKRMGIRFPYGDLQDLIKVLTVNPNTRQAYLPIWFPEDLGAAREGQRVPCSMGYHFISPGPGLLDCVYTMRSCDVVRFYRDDIYMAGRLLQHVAGEVELALARQGAGSAAELAPHRLIVHIDNLHCFPGDRPHLESIAPPMVVSSSVADKRAGYNFGALG